MTVKNRDNLVSIGIALASIFILAWVIPTFTPPYPGYGVSSALLPNVVFGIILALSILALLTNVTADYMLKKEGANKKLPEDREIPPEERVHLWHLISFMIPCILVFPAMQWIGFIPAGLVFMVLMQFFCGQRKPLTTIIVAVAVVGLMYAAMRYGLGIPMP